MKIEVMVNISTTFIVSDTGYTRNMNLDAIEKWADDKIRTLTLHLQEGGSGPRPVPAKFKIEQIRFTPDS